MPFKSKAQRRFMYAAEARGDVPEGTARRWEKHTPKNKELPERVEKTAFQIGFEKRANFPHAAEIAGLGILAAPSAASLAGKPVSEKTKDISEIAGLGVLALPSIAHFASKSKTVSKALPFIKNMV